MRLPGVLTRTPERACWVIAFALVAGLGSAWAFATPIFASPDEPSHVVRAYGAAHGQLLGDEFDPDDVPPYPIPIDPKPWVSGLSIDAPARYQHWGNVNCIVFNLNPKANASCLRLEGPDREVRTVIFGGRFPPEYYVVVGTPSLVISAGRGQVYAMRLLTVLIVAALLASAAVTLRAFAPGPFGVLGFAVALSPSVLFLTGSVNPSAVEIAAAISVWVHGAALAGGALEALGPRLVHRLGIALTVLVVSRNTSLLWVALIGLVLAATAGWTRLKALWQERLVRRWTVGIAAAVVVQLAWFAYADTLNLRKSISAIPLPNESVSEILRTVVGRQHEWFRQMIGVFGWNDTPAPGATFILWIAALGALIALAVAAARRFVPALGATFALCVVVPIAYQAPIVHEVGYIWQGRYLLPLAVGIPILAGIALARADDHRLRVTPVTLIVALALAVAHFLGFAQALRRYSVGKDGSIWFVSSSGWDPPIPSLLLLVAFGALLAAGVVALVRSSRPRPVMASA